MSDLKLDRAALDELFKDLLNASSAFSGIEWASRTVADAVGHPGLRGRVEEFATGWDDRRPEIIASLDTMWRAVQAIEDEFGKLDGQLAAAFQAEK